MSRFLLIIFFLPVTLLAQNWTSNSMLDDKNFKTNGNYQVKIGINYSNVTGDFGEYVEYKPLILPRVSFGYMLDMNNFIFIPNLTLDGHGYKRIETYSWNQFEEIEDKFSSILLNLDFLFQYKIFNNFFIDGGAYINSNIADKYSYKYIENGSIVYEDKGEYNFDDAFSNVNYGLIIACSIDLNSNLSSSIGLERNINLANTYNGSFVNLYNNGLRFLPYNIFLTFGYKI